MPRFCAGCATGRSRRSATRSSPSRRTPSGGSCPRGSTSADRCAGVDGLVQVIDQLGGVALPASAWESLVLPARLRDYSPAWLDELTVSGEVLWSGAGALPGHDGWVALHLAESVAVTLPEPVDAPTTELQREILVALAGGGAFFFRQLGAAVGSMTTASS